MSWSSKVSFAVKTHMVISWVVALFGRKVGDHFRWNPAQKLGQNWKVTRAYHWSWGWTRLVDEEDQMNCWNIRPWKGSFYTRREERGHDKQSF